MMTICPLCRVSRDARHDHKCLSVGRDVLVRHRRGETAGIVTRVPGGEWVMVDCGSEGPRRVKVKCVAERF